MKWPEYVINAYFECPNCISDEREQDFVALRTDNEAIMWCSCGKVYRMRNHDRWGWEFKEITDMAKPYEEV